MSPAFQPGQRTWDSMGRDLAKQQAGGAAALHFAEKARELTEFCVRRGQSAFDGWDVRTLYRYVFFHVVTRTVFCVRSQGVIIAAAFAWGECEAKIRRRASEGKPFFAWQKSADHADAIFVAHVVGEKKDLPRLLRQVEQRWPDLCEPHGRWRKKVFTWRDGALHELTPEVLERMLHG